MTRPCMLQLFQMGIDAACVLRRVFDGQGCLVAVSHHFGKNPYAGLDPLGLQPNMPLGACPDSVQAMANIPSGRASDPHVWAVREPCDFDGFALDPSPMLALCDGR